MLILDKKKDIETLISMGATRQFILKVFFLEGVFINLLGGIIGISVGLLIAWLQLTFHFVTLDNSVITYWPVSDPFFRCFDGFWNCGFNWNWVVLYSG